jgi:GWxTD domain-containing protein
VGALPLVWAVLGGCSGEPAPSSAPAAELTSGPLRWLMLPQEEKEARGLRSSRDAVDFLERFWRRRNPDPNSTANECARLFHERVAAADRLYGEGGTRGSLTDRGRALILLGPPPVLRYGQHHRPSWEPGRSGARPLVHSQLVTVETWIYPRAELSPELAALLALIEPEATASGSSGAPAAPGGPVMLEFLSDSPHHTRLREGGYVLELAARALVRNGR